MKPKLINLTDRQHEWLNKEAAGVGVPVSELIRRLLDAHIDFEEAKQKIYSNAPIKDALPDNTLGITLTR